jgi:hypothetical protein
VLDTLTASHGSPITLDRTRVEIDDCPGDSDFFGDFQRRRSLLSVTEDEPISSVAASAAAASAAAASAAAASAAAASAAAASAAATLAAVLDLETWYPSFLRRLNQPLYSDSAPQDAASQQNHNVAQNGGYQSHFLGHQRPGAMGSDKISVHTKARSRRQGSGTTEPSGNECTQASLGDHTIRITIRFLDLAMQDLHMFDVNPLSVTAGGATCPVTAVTSDAVTLSPTSMVRTSPDDLMDPITTTYIVSPIGCPPDSGRRHILDRDECSAAAVALELASTNAVVNQGSNRGTRPKQYGDMLSPSFVFLPVLPGLCWLGC